jgi:hypothetical protein
MSKNVVKSEWPQIRHNVAHTRRMLGKQGYMHKPTQPGTHTHVRAPRHTDKCVILLFFHGNECYANAPQYYVIRTLPDLSNVVEVMRTCDFLVVLVGVQFISVLLVDTRPGRTS